MTTLRKRASKRYIQPRLEQEHQEILANFIRGNGGFMAKVFQGLEEGKTPGEIQREVGHKNAWTVIEFSEAIEIFLGMRPTQGCRFHSKKQAVYKARRFFKAYGREMPPVLYDHLQGVYASRLGITNNNEEEQSGVYVFSYTHYLKYPYSGDRTIFKIGQSSDPFKRLERFKRETSVPEDIVLLRIFRTADHEDLEKQFREL